MSRISLSSTLHDIELQMKANEMNNDEQTHHMWLTEAKNKRLFLSLQRNLVTLAGKVSFSDNSSQNKVVQQIFMENVRNHPKLTSVMQRLDLFTNQEHIEWVRAVADYSSESNGNPRDLFNHIFGISPKTTSFTKEETKSHKEIYSICMIASSLISIIAFLFYFLKS